MEKEGRIKKVDFPKEPEKKIVIPKEIGKYKLHIISVLEKSGLGFEEEYKFDEVRKFRFDWAIEKYRIAIEYEGIFSEKSGHTTISGYTKDITKYNLATKLGWQILRYTADNYLEIENDLKLLIEK
ncbi:hypothetical protein [Chryseobacterium piscium]|uniref:hypothetical protein n=1 Tax=Chryseobacterium piscium TaxID=333702 RepID=UPI000F4E6592|nr:hypothetical protein [Chryseobacterium piscium]